MWGCTLSSLCPQSGHLYFILFYFFLPDSNFKKHKHTSGVTCAATRCKHATSGTGCVRTARRVRRRHACSSCGALARLPTSRSRPSYPSDVWFHLSPSSRRGGGGVPAHVLWHGVADLWVCGGLFYASPPIERHGWTGWTLPPGWRTDTRPPWGIIMSTTCFKSVFWVKGPVWTHINIFKVPYYSHFRIFIFCPSLQWNSPADHPLKNWIEPQKQHTWPFVCSPPQKTLAETDASKKTTSVLRAFTRCLCPKKHICN